MQSFPRNHYLDGNDQTNRLQPFIELLTISKRDRVIAIETIFMQFDALEFARKKQRPVLKEGWYKTVRKKSCHYRTHFVIRGNFDIYYIAIFRCKNFTILSGQTDNFAIFRSKWQFSRYRTVDAFKLTFTNWHYIIFFGFNII